MTEEDWLASAVASTRMLSLLRRSGGKRKLIRIGCACCRRFWHLLEEYGQAAVELAERFVDGLVSQDHAILAAELAAHVPDLGWPSEEQRTAARAASLILQGEAAYRVAFACEDVRAEREAQWLLVRDVYGGPKGAPPLAPALLAWDRGTVRLLAQAAHERRSLPRGTLDTARLRVLADALEEAGCADGDLLAHLRSPGPHVRGCFALAAVLGKD